MDGRASVSSTSVVSISASTAPGIRLAMYRLSSAAPGTSWIELIYVTRVGAWIVGRMSRASVSFHMRSTAIASSLVIDWRTSRQ